MMCHFYFCLVLSLFCIDVNARNEANALHRCGERSEVTEVIISTQQSGFEVINKYSSKILNRRINRSSPGDYVVGLTSLQSTTSIDFEGPVWQDDETGGECFAPRIEISLQYAPIQVFIGNEFEPGSCSYRAILDHEKQHIQLYVENLPRVESVLRELMEKRFRSKPIYAPKGTAKKLLETEIDELWRPLIKAEFSKIQIDQNQLDTDEGLASVSWACLGEVQKILGFRY